MEPARPEEPAPPPGPAEAGAPDAAPPAPPRRPRAVTFLVLQLALLPVGLAAQALHAAAGLVWSQLFLFALPAAALTAAAGLAPAPFLRLVPPPPRALGLSLLAGAAALLVGGALQALWAGLLPEPVLQAFDVGRLFERPSPERTVLIATATVLAPVCEELAFRGHLLGALALRHRPGAAIALSAVIFAALHLDPVRFPGLVFLGALFGWLAWRSGSVYPAILAHAVNNAAATALALGSDASERAAPGDPAAAATALAVGLGLLALPVLALQRVLPAPQPAEASLVPGAAFPVRWPPWVRRAAWAAIVSLVLMALAPRR